MGRLTTLLKWHLADPVNDAERRRHDLVYSYQLNRNPFVDHPEWVEAVFLPRLKVTRVEGGIIVTWPRHYSARLERSPGLHMPWFAWPNPSGTNQPNGEWGAYVLTPFTPVFVRLLLE